MRLLYYAVIGFTVVTSGEALAERQILLQSGFDNKGAVTRLFADTAEERAKVFDEVSPAKIYFILDDMAENKTVGVEGALISKWSGPVSGGTLRQAALYTGIGVSYNNVANVKSKNTIAFRLGAAGFLDLDLGFADDHILSADIGWLTDSGFEASALSFTAYYDPLLKILGNARPLNFGSLDQDRPEARPYLKWSTPVKAEYLKVFKEGGSLPGDGDYTYLGPSLSFLLGFGTGHLFEKVALEASYQKFYAFTKDNENLDKLDIELRYILNQANNFSISLRYEDGREPTTKEVDKVSLELGLKF